MADTLRPPLQPSSRPSHNEPSPDDLQKLKAWHEERLQRKLRGEYESERLHLAQLVNDSLDAPLRIASVRVQGANHTSQSFLGWLIRPHLAPFTRPPQLDPDAPPPTAQSTLHTVLQTTRGISHTLSATDLFRDLSARIERANTGTMGGVGRDDEVDVVFDVKERGRFFLKSSTEIGNGEGSASLTARLTNILGCADTFSLNTSLGTKTKRAFDASFSLPISSSLSIPSPSHPFPALSTHAFLGVVGTERELGVQGGGGQEERVAVRGGVRYSGGGGLGGMHELTAEGIWRCIGGLSADAGITIRQSAGPSLKASLAHTYTRDTLDDRVMPRRGAWMRLVNELAVGGRVLSDPFPVSGLGSSSPLGGLFGLTKGVGSMGEEQVAFWRTEGELRKGLGLGSGAVLTLSARAGHLNVLSGDADAVHYSDKFFLGGPLSVRAFSVGGMGAREGVTSIGGDLYYALGLSLLGNVPGKREWPVKLHGWVNAGRVQGVGEGAALSQTLHHAIIHPSISVGLGLVYRFDPARVELNFGLPIVAAKGETLRRGVSVGVGLEFL
ncbi:surface antigen-domain-containing protein [Phlebopus sp. FC_14]|nr:surface antigen-domain-containing protein [Phlebopus sp. FC_14]